MPIRPYDRRLIEGEIPRYPNWIEDGSSPLNDSGSSSYTITLASSYDLIKVLVQELNVVGSTNPDPALRINGDDGSNYDYVDANGTETTGDTVAFLASNARNSAARFRFFVHESGGASEHGIVPEYVVRDASNRILNGLHDGSTTDINSLTIINDVGNNFSIKARVFGWVGEIS